MQVLRRLLQDRSLPSLFRSQREDGPLDDDTACLVLDTIGDLRDFYAAATVAHVGVDHNVLEPLAFDKPVTVLPGWESTYPSYPVYRLLHEQGALLEADAESLAGQWQIVLAGGARLDRQRAHAREVLTRAGGAVGRHLEAAPRVGWSRCGEQRPAPACRACARVVRPEQPARQSGLAGVATSCSFACWHPRTLD